MSTNLAHKNSQEENLPGANPQMVKQMLVFSAIILAIMAALSAWAWQQLPAGASIPVHWGIDGQPDRFGGKLEGLWLLPLVNVGLVLLFSLLPRIDPKGENILRSYKAYRALWAGFLIFMLGMHAILIANILGSPINVTYFLMPASGLMFIVLGNYMGKIRRNYTMGIRTPWTLASDRVWDKTHRLGGWLLVLSGIVTTMTPFFLSAPTTIYVMLSGLLGTTLVSVVYSYWVWRQERVATE